MFHVERLQGMQMKESGQLLRVADSEVVFHVERARVSVEMHLEILDK
jgi:hypothetical protein